MNISRNAVRICIGALTAALYAALTIILAPISYGPIQLRVSEVLCVLPYFAPFTCWGLTLGCALANLLTGSIPDVVFGSLATLLAGLCTARRGKGEHNGRSAFLACLMPVIFNAFIVGGVLVRTYSGIEAETGLTAYLLTSMWVGIGEAAVMLLPGMAAIRLLPGYRAFKELMEKIN